MSLIPVLIDEVPKLGSISAVSGKVSAIQGQTISAKLPQASLGDICEIEADNLEKIYAQVVSFNEQNIFLAPFSDIRGIGQRILAAVSRGRLPMFEELLSNDHQVRLKRTIHGLKNNKIPYIISRNHRTD